MTIELFIDKLTVLGNSLASILERIAKIESEVITTKIIKRLETEGVDAKGNKYGKFAVKGAYSRGWGGHRKTKGYQINIKDFHFTGAMLSSINEISSTKSKDVISIITGAGDGQRDKMESNVDQEGELLEGNEKEINELVAAFDKELQIEINKRL